MRYLVKKGIHVCLLAAMFGSMAACRTPVDPLEHVTLDLRTDAGVLNYVYAITQLEADFYGRPYATRFPGMRNTELGSFQMFQGTLALTANDFLTTHDTGRITDYILFQIGDRVDWSDRASVMTTAQTIADAAARGISVAGTYAKTSQVAEKVSQLAAAALSRANTIRSYNGAGPLVVGSPSPVEVMQQLQLYYRTTVTVVVP